MKIMHIADLHIGKRVNGFSMLDEQRHVIINQCVETIKNDSISAVLISGDVYDKNVPQAEAVGLLDEFLTALSEMGTHVFIISGNHDSAERLNFGSRILEKNNLHIYSVFDGNIPKTTLHDNDTDVNIYMLPFIKPAVAASVYNDNTIQSYDNAVKYALGKLYIDESKINILIAHQFVTWDGITPETSESEMISVGGIDNVDVSAFEKFDYTALGHIHRPQKIKSDCIRYAGSILKYSFSEINYNKSAVIIDVKSKDDIDISFKPLLPINDMREVKGKLANIIANSADDENKNDYIHAILTDDDELYDAVGQLRRVYPQLMKIDFENKSTLSDGNSDMSIDKMTEKSISELFSEFYEKINNNEMTQRQNDIMDKLFEDICENGVQE